MSYSSRIFFYGPVGLLLLVVVLYSVFWRVQADTLAVRLDRANGGEVIPGVVFAFAEKSVGGFPFRIDAVLSGVTFSHQAPEGETAWRVEKLALHRLSYGQNRYIFEASGLQSFAQPPVKPGTGPRVLYVTPGLTQASAILVGDRLTRFDLDLIEPQAKDATPGANPTRTLMAARAQLHLLARPDNSIDIAIEIDNARIGAGYAAGGAETVLPLIDARAKLDKADVLDSLRAGTQSVADAVADWRGQMGTIAVSKLTLTWPDAHAELNGQLTLDEQGLLAGTLTSNGAKDGKAPAGLTLAFAKGDIRVASGSALPGRGP
ncbi:MAG TPA: DUF2125 domain-containing protein [Micropepsaceae bacterium]|jgi:hypothetical protein|nr:DUF2125 domain-containing protein [Micropepsaceae bacterium]